MPRSFAPTNTPPALAGPAPSGGEPPDEALGRSQGGFSTKIHLRAEGHGRPITAVLTGGERHEQIALEDVLDRGAIPRSGRGRPRLRPRRVAGDKGYSSPTARRRLRQRRITPVIPSKSNQRRQPHFDHAADRLRNRVERLINRLKQFRRIATRYEKRAANDLAMLTIGMILLWI
jgi:transposase